MAQWKDFGRWFSAPASAERRALGMTQRGAGPGAQRSRGETGLPARVEQLESRRLLAGGAGGREHVGQGVLAGVPDAIE
jgi:hypothetical protein